MENSVALLGLRTVVYMVEELEKAKDWYAKAFNVNAYYDSPHYVGFNVCGYELGLHPTETSKGKDTGTVLHYWGVENVKESYAILLELGAKKHEEPFEVEGDLMLASVYDPWDNIIGIIYNPHFKLP
ncbi:VOC family protein [Aureisphaera sp. CAU 1614]|uniref:VOC family protein n=1 Tax=Halomarinibacterium sedimenti TaxID=2857106 RepID=A0A9X1FQB8_9FLAO|nr:VOC family protein [Halomarinibacterium sedimenti]MBW2938848.1 VOC family protein [Halomarinibacterium sedimenti]